MNTNFYIKQVEPRAGIKIDEIAQDLQLIVDDQNVPMSFNFNGVNCKVNLNGDPVKLIDGYNNAIKEKNVES